MMGPPDFWSLAHTRLSSAKLCAVMISQSPHWQAEGQQWLAQYVARKVAEFSNNVCVVLPENMDWPYDEINTIKESEVLQLEADKEHVVRVFSAGHNCPEASRLRNDFTKNTFDFTAWAIDGHKVGIESFKNDWNDIRVLFSLLSDITSIDTLSSLVYARISGQLSAVKISHYPIYFHPCLRFSEFDGLIVDGGAFDGSDAINFSQKANPSAKILTFEPDNSNYKLLGQVIADSSSGAAIRPINAGLWNVADTLKISGSGIAARVSDTGEQSVKLVTLDEIANGEKVSFVKLDIEGAECMAIDGMVNIIRDQAPALAISLYHQADDLWRIPLKIKNINPKYKFYIGQHDTLLSETVLYAVTD